MAPALEVEAEVEINSTVKVEINGEEVSDKNIGKRRVDHKNKIAGFTFVGLNVRPGPNKLQRDCDCGKWFRRTAAGNCCDGSRPGASSGNHD